MDRGDAGRPVGRPIAAPAVASPALAPPKRRSGAGAKGWRSNAPCRRASIRARSRRGRCASGASPGPGVAGRGFGSTARWSGRGGRRPCPSGGSPQPVTRRAQGRRGGRLAPSMIGPRAAWFAVLVIDQPAPASARRECRYRRRRVAADCCPITRQRRRWRWRQSSSRGMDERRTPTHGQTGRPPSRLAIGPRRRL